MTTIKDFKDGFLDAVFSASAKTFLPICLAYLIQAILMIIIIVPIVIFMLGIDMNFLESLTDPAALSNPDIFSDYMKDLMSNFMNPKSIFSIVLMVIAVLLVTSWFYNFCYLFVHRYVKTNEMNFGQTLSESFSDKIIKTFLLTLIFSFAFFIIYILIIFLVGACVSIHFSIGILVGLASMIFLLGLFIKTSLAYPILLISEKGITDSISESLKTIDIKTSMKYALYVILGSIVVFIVMILVLGLVSLILGFLGPVGAILNIVVQVLFSGFTSAATVALVLGMFYHHYYKEESETLDLEENLIN